MTACDRLRWLFILGLTLPRVSSQALAPNEEEWPSPCSTPKMNVITKLQVSPYLPLSDSGIGQDNYQSQR